MSPAQKYLHWQRWTAVVAANRWKMRKGFLLEEAEASRGRSEHHAQVWVYAEQLAQRERRGVTADDLRHACYLSAFGRVASMAEADPMTTGEFNRLLSLWALLVDPDNITAVMEHDHPDLAARRGLIVAIRKAAPGEAYIIAVSKNKFGTGEWRNLGDAQLRQLVMTLKGRARRAAMTKDKAQMPKRELENAPF